MGLQELLEILRVLIALEDSELRDDIMKLALVQIKEILAKK